MDGTDAFNINQINEEIEQAETETSENCGDLKKAQTAALERAELIQNLYNLRQQDTLKKEDVVKQSIITLIEYEFVASSLVSTI